MRLIWYATPFFATHTLLGGCTFELRATSFARRHELKPLLAHLTICHDHNFAVIEHGMLCSPLAVQCLIDAELLEGVDLSDFYPREGSVDD